MFMNIVLLLIFDETVYRKLQFLLKLFSIIISSSWMTGLLVCTKDKYITYFFSVLRNSDLTDNAMRNNFWNFYQIAKILTYLIQMSFWFKFFTPNLFYDKFILSKKLFYAKFILSQKLFYAKFIVSQKLFYAKNVFTPTMFYANSFLRQYFLRQYFFTPKNAFYAKLIFLA